MRALLLFAVLLRHLVAYMLGLQAFAVSPVVSVSDLKDAGVHKKIVLFLYVLFIK